MASNVEDATIRWLRKTTLFDSSRDETDIPDINLRSDTITSAYNALSRAIEAIKDGLAAGSMPDMLDEETAAEAILEDVCKQLTQVIAIDKRNTQSSIRSLWTKLHLGSSQSHHRQRLARTPVLEWILRALPLTSTRIARPSDQRHRALRSESALD